MLMLYRAQRVTMDRRLSYQCKSLTSLIAFFLIFWQIQPIALTANYPLEQVLQSNSNLSVQEIEPIDSGEMDNFALLGLLDKVGYKGRIGFQGYSIGGDVYHNLRRSILVFREMEERLERHPNWGSLI